MAERRMISQKIINMDSYTQMPNDSKFLYMILVVNADDDGFVGNPRGLCDMNHISVDCMRLLAFKKFIIPFECGCVVIRHWHHHNKIAKNRYKPTIYWREKQMLTEIKGEYFLFGSEEIPELTDENPPEEKPEEDFVGEVFNNFENLADTGKGRIGKESGGKFKNRLMEDRSGKDNAADLTEPDQPNKQNDSETEIPTLEQVTDYCEQRRAQGYPNYIDPVRFMNYNEDRDWKNTNGQPVRWKSLIRTWETHCTEQDRVKFEHRKQEKAQKMREDDEMNAYLSLVNRFDEEGDMV
jgi:hypothetical protein